MIFLGLLVNGLVSAGKSSPETIDFPSIPIGHGISGEDFPAETNPLRRSGSGPLACHRARQILCPVSRNIYVMRYLQYFFYAKNQSRESSMLCGSGTVQGYRRIQAKNDCWFSMLHPSLAKISAALPASHFQGAYAVGRQQ